MRTLFRAVWQSISLMILTAVWGVAGAYTTIAPYAPMYLASISITIAALFTLIPGLVFTKMLTGVTWCVYAAALLAALLLFALGLLASPIGILIGMLKGKTVNPAPVGQKYVRFVGIVLFTELMLSMFVLMVPYHNNLDMLPVWFLAAATVVTGSMIWGGWLSARFYQFAATLAFVIITVSFFLPQSFAAASNRAGRFDSQLAYEIDPQDYPICPGARDYKFQSGKNDTIMVPISPTCWSGWIIVPEQYAGWDFDSPGELEFLMADGRRIRLAKNEGSYGWRPTNRFRLRGEGPHAMVTIEK